MTDPERTIAAQATAAGQGAIAVIRMSGPGCMDILKQCTPCGFHGTPPAAQGDAGLHPGRGRSRH